MLLLLLLLLLLLQATISTSGSFPELPASRSVELRLFSSVPPTTVTANGQTIPYSRFGGPNTWTYDGVELSTIINLADVTPKTTMEVDVNTAVLPNADAVFSGLRVSGVEWIVVTFLLSLSCFSPCLVLCLFVLVYTGRHAPRQQRQVPV